MQRVSVREAVPLVDETSGKIEEIPGFEHHLQDRHPNFRLIKVCWKTKQFALKKNAGCNWAANYVLRLIRKVGLDKIAE